MRRSDEIGETMNSLQNHFAAVAEDLDTLFVGPIVNDVAEEVGVGSAGDAFE